MHFIKNNKSFVCLTIVGLLLISLFCYFFNKTETEYDLFTGSATIFSAWVVLAVYFVQKWNAKVEAAQIIFIEIEKAQDSLEEIKRIIDARSYPLPASISVLPINSWIKYQHLFVFDFDRSEQKSMNNFYEYCFLVEKNIENMRNYIPTSIDEKIRKTQREVINLLAELSKETDEEKYKEREKEYYKKKFRMENNFNKEFFTFSPDFSVMEILKYINRVQHVSNLSVGTKLKKIANF